MEFKDKLKKLRTDNGLSQEALADAVHISRSAIAKYENGNGNPSQETLNALSVYFGVDVDDLKSDGATKRDTNKKALKLLACTVWELVENEGHSEWWLNFAFGLTQKETRYLLNKIINNDERS